MADGPLIALGNQQLRTDANGYLLISRATTSGSNGPLTNGLNIRVRLDASGYLLVAQK